MTAPTILTCEQGSPEWYVARSRIPTASQFSTVLAKGEGKTRRSYMLKLAGEIITGEPMENYVSADMERGKVMEEEARDLYTLLSDDPVTRVGFAVNAAGTAGCSPDSLVGDKGMLEIKTQRADLLIATILAGKFPSEHIAQCQGSLWVLEREWADLFIYWPKVKPFMRRIYRDEPYIINLAIEVGRFNEELAEMVEAYRGYGTAPSLKDALVASLA